MIHQCMACSSHTTRRGFLRSLAATGAGAVMPFAATPAQPAPGKGRLDVHHHVFPPEAIALSRNPAQKSWTIARAVEELDRNGVATGIASAGSATPADKARVFNDFAARLGGDYKGRFGLFATLPLPDIDASLKEIEYGLDVLKADGIGLVTSYGELWLGDPKLRPVLAELNRRKAVVYVHPTDAPCCVNLSYWTPPVVGSWIEWPMHTARTILSLMLNRVMIELPDIKFIFAHDGGTMPMLVGRLAGFTQITRADFREKFRAIFPNGVEAEYRKLYFDIAQGTYPVNMAAMRSLVPDAHILFGSDYPYFSIATAADGLGRLGLPDALKRAIERGNAEALFPRWRA
jgi:predicted TIM-barrel fold metal-dependent hydrolase